MAMNEPDADDAGGTMSKEQAQYRNGNPLKHCGLCRNYQGDSCKIVAGSISPYMISNEYNPHTNPLQAQGITFSLHGSEVWRKKREARRQETGKGSVGKAKQAKGKTRIGKQSYD